MLLPEEQQGNSFTGCVSKSNLLLERQTSATDIFLPIIALVALVEF